MNINRKDLLAGIQLACTAVDTRVVALPILRTVQLRAHAEQLHIAGTNLTQHIATRVPATNDTKWECCVDATLIKQVVSAEDAKELTLEMKGDKLVVTGGSSVFKLETQKADEFPPHPVSSKSETKVECAELSKHINAVSHAASVDTSRAALCGIHFDGKNIVATDGRRLAASEMAEALFGDAKITVPTESVKAILAVLATNEQCSVALDGHLHVTTPRADVAVKLVDATYPNWRQVIPTKHRDEATIVVTNQLLADAIARVSLCAKKDGPGIVWAMSSEALSLSANNEEGSANEEIEATCIGNAKIGLNLSFLLDAIVAPDTEVVTINIADELSPVVVSCYGYTAIVMPMRVGD